MKAHIIYIVACMLCIEATAQEALGGGTAIVSPQINGNGSVTFRLSAPDARQAGVTGDFLPPVKIENEHGSYSVPATAQMSRNDNGVWEYTTADSIAPELYSYSFVIDGIRVNDPANVYQIRDVATVSNVFLIPGGSSDYYKVGDVPHGTVSKVWYPSATLGMERRMTVYTPAGYDGGGDRRYPVLYLLHGMGGDEEAWPQLGRATQILDNMIAAGQAEPMIVVMPNGNAAMAAAPGETPQGFAAPSMALPKTMDGSFEAHFPELVSFIDANYRTIAGKGGRAIAGLSMGGFHAMNISREYPGDYDYVGLFSAATIPGQNPESPVYQNADTKLAAQFAHAPALYWIGIGSDDFLFDANSKYRRELDGKGYQYVYRQSDGGHTWRNWRIYLTEFLPLLFK